MSQPSPVLAVNLERYRISVLKAAVEGRLVPTESELARREGRDYEPASALLQRILAERRRRWQETELAKMKAKGRVPKDERWKAKYKEPVAPDTSELPELPEGWCWGTVDQVVAGDRACAYGVLQPGPDVANGVPLVRVGDILNGRVDPETLKRIDPKIAAEYPRTRLQGGEILISLVGAIGRIAVASENLRGANTARAVGVIPVSRLLAGPWIGVWFRSSKQRVELIGKAHEVARKTLNLEDVRTALVAIPPLSEQRRLVEAVDDQLSVVNALRLNTQRTLGRSRFLRQSILKWAFEGKLVDQDPDDEPASVLLERIRAQRQASGGARSRRRRGRRRDQAQSDLFS